MDQFLVDLHDFSVVNLDDIIVFSGSWSQHLEYLDIVFNHLTSVSLVVKLWKSLFAMQSCQFLGHIVGRELISPTDGKISALFKFSTPKTRRRCMHSWNWLSITDDSSLSLLTHLHVGLILLESRNTTKSYGLLGICTAWKRNSAPAQSWSALTIPKNLSCKQMLQTGAVYSRRMTKILTIQQLFFSHKFLPQEVIHTTIVKECLAIVAAVQHFAIYLLRVSFVEQSNPGTQV